jgi:non-ribosomal peptide synthase protein (TIGR01720 family)
MAPTAYVEMRSLPLTANGKLDRKALPGLENFGSELREGYVEPRTAVEEKLAAIWSRILQVERVGVHDNYFELGGDSILMIQILSRASQQGLKFTLRQAIQYQTIAELAGALSVTPVNKIDQLLVTGSMPLTPSQLWFFEQNLPDPHHYNQAVLFQTEQPLEPSLIEKAVRALLKHHDALRLRFARAGAVWEQVNAGVEETTPFAFVDLSMTPDAEQTRALTTAAARYQSSLHITTGPVIRVVLFSFGPERMSYLLFVVHHLVVDGVSWRILIEDLQSAYVQLTRGEPIQLPLKTSSYKQYAESLIEYARSPALMEEKYYWLSRRGKDASPLPRDFPEGENTTGSVDLLSASLSRQATETLLRVAPRALQIQINDALLTALALCFSRWTGRRSLLVDLEGHGREDKIGDLDLSRTIGWFTAIFPVLVNLGETSQTTEMLMRVKEQLRRIPNHGVGYGLFRYLGEDRQTSEMLQSLPRAEIIFNYLGRFDDRLSGEGGFTASPIDVGPLYSPRQPRRHLIEINGSMTNGQFRFAWKYSKNIHRAATIERLLDDYLEALESLALDCQRLESEGRAHHGFMDIEVSRESIDKALAEIDIG